MTEQPLEYSEDDYYEMIDEALNKPGDEWRWLNYPIDLVATPTEWKRFKAALARWVEHMDEEHELAFDEMAREEEHEGD